MRLNARTEDMQEVGAWEGRKQRKRPGGVSSALWGRVGRRSWPWLPQCWTHQHCPGHVTKSSPPARQALQPNDLCCWLRLTTLPSPQRRCVSTSTPLSTAGECASQQYSTLNYMLKQKNKTNVEHNFSVCFCLLGFFWCGFGFFLPLSFLVFAGAGLCLTSLQRFKVFGMQLPVPPSGGDKTLQWGQEMGCQSMPQSPLTTFI